MASTKQKNKLTWYQSLITKQTLILLALFIPFYIAGFLIYRWGSDAIRENIERTMAAGDKMVVTSLESQMDTLVALQINLFSDQDLLLLEGTQDSYTSYERGKMMLRVQEKLLMICNSNVLLKNVEVYIPSARLCIGSFMMSSRSDEQIATLQSDVEGTSGARMVNKNGTLHLLLPCRERNYIKYLFDVTFSDYKLGQMLRQADTTTGAGVVLFQNYGYEHYEGNPYLEKPITQLVQAGLTEGTQIRNLDGISYFCNRTDSARLGMSLLHCVPFTQAFQKLQRLNKVFFALCFISFFGILLFFIYFNNYLKKPLRILMEAFQKFCGGEMNCKVTYRRKDEFRILAQSFNQMTDDWQRMINNIYEKELLLQKAELKQLQSQIDPHFLYNSFFILRRRVQKGDIPGSVTFCEQLGEYFRFVTRNTSDTVPLSAEVGHAHNYSDIQMTRFGKRIEVSFSPLPAEAETILVPRLILQPIIENAFEHGLKEKEENGQLKISFRQTPQGLDAVMEDNGDGLTDTDIQSLDQQLTKGQEVREITALYNINLRLKIFYGEEYGVKLFHSELGGLGVCLHLGRCPLERRDDHVPHLGG